MKDPTRGPIFACLYPGMCDVARRHGYALTIHGTLVNDVDLVAIPWTADARPPEVLKDALMKHIGACGYDDLLKRDSPWLSEEQRRQVCAQQGVGLEGECSERPHGRLSWNLYLWAGTKVDLSVMPRENPVTGAGLRRQPGEKCVDYVCGFLFNGDFTNVLLIRKKRPEWQAGLLNGVGGKVEDGETPYAAMEREFMEETGQFVGAWKHFGKMKGFTAGCYSKSFKVDYFGLQMDNISGFEDFVSQTDELLEVIAVERLTPTRKDVVENVPWLVGLAIDSLKDGRPGFTIIHYP